MEVCLNIMHPVHSENLITYVLLEELKHRNFNYTLTKDLYIYSLKHKYTTNLFLNEINKNKWINTLEINQTSKNVQYTFTKDNFPDKYNLTYGWGQI